jgi:glycine betaine/proline transport system ATP-binding protein
MRPVDDGLKDTCQVVKQDQIVRDAAKAILAAPCCCRVVDGDRTVGMVDDEDIIRVVVAEEDAS